MFTYPNFKEEVYLSDNFLLYVRFSEGILSPDRSVLGPKSIFSLLNLKTQKDHFRVQKVLGS